MAAVPKPTLRSGRVVLVPQAIGQARGLPEGDAACLDLAPGYPHADTADGLRMWVEHGGPDDGGWFVTLAEDGRVAIRHVRRDALELLKKEEKAGDISEDQSEVGEKEIQKLTDQYSGKIDSHLAVKEKEIMTV